ncbi:MAG: mannose-6-phosphate isomerase, class I, partial [Spirochaetota bacterium]
YPLDNTIQKYPWGDKLLMPGFLGKSNPGNEPWAELWMGAHPKAPSMALCPDGSSMGLDKLIEKDPPGMLGIGAVERFAGKLPFLFKVLSAGMPLSIQAHPSKLKAQRGFAKEQEAGIPLDAPERNYRDDNHKPETVVALTRFDGLCGFRPIDEIILNIKLASGARWRNYAGRLAADPGKLELSVLFYNMVSLKGQNKAYVLKATRLRGERIVQEEPPGSSIATIFNWILKLMDEYPGDIGALAPLLLNLFTLEPGQALFLAAGEPHAYLGGLAAEIMANSDNVLRGGLTSKHIDIPELISVLNFDSHPIGILDAKPGPDGFSSYPVRCDDFMISRARPKGSLMVEDRPESPEILLCTDGQLEISLLPGKQSKNGQAVVLKKGESAFIPASETTYQIEGQGELFKAAVPAIQILRVPSALPARQ